VAERGVFSGSGTDKAVAKANFTAAGVLWLWLAIGLNLVGIALPLYTGNPIVFIMLVMSAPFLVAMIAVMWLDRYHLTKLVQRSLGNG
jgi:hypothetical protein